VSIKRLNYFTHQFLREQDFKDEQAYHLEMRRRHNQLLHGWGVVTGLEVQKKGEREITISHGMAIDKEGRELVLFEPVIRDLTGLERSSLTHIIISYAERWDDADRQAAGGVEGYTRLTESTEIKESKQDLGKDGSVVTLARVHVNDVGHIHRIETDAMVRKVIAPSNPAAGWMRLPFKPTRVASPKSGARIHIGADEEVDFIIEEDRTYCEERGARGWMSIPVPPAAKSIVGFRIAGTTRGSVTVNLVRTGWNLHENKGERTELLKEIVSGASFHRDIAVNFNLDESHALAVWVKAEGQTEILLVAAKFE
jgi:hypothetical protein